MKESLIKAVVMRLLFTSLLLVSLTCFGQDLSNGTPLPEKTVANTVYPDCKATDKLLEHFNTRGEVCPSNFFNFINGDKRQIIAGDGVNPFANFTSAEQNAYGSTVCQASGNATWIRNMVTTDDQLTWFIQWNMSWWPRKADNSLDVSQKKTFGPLKACTVYKEVADGGGGEPELGGNTPIVIDLNNDGIVRLTDKAGGVRFDLNMGGDAEQIPWLADGNDGWLVMFPPNGLITDGSMLFGPGDKDNGYLLLAGFDDNKDGVIDAKDGVWSEVLAIWRDLNHNGVSEPGELTHMPYSGIASISTEFKESRRKDKHGNEFRYRAKIKFVDGREGHSFDVILSAK